MNSNHFLQDDWPLYTQIIGCFEVNFRPHHYIYIVFVVFFDSAQNINKQGICQGLEELPLLDIKWIFKGFDLKKW